jgi:hypothetical protein
LKLAEDRNSTNVPEILQIQENLLDDPSDEQNETDEEREFRSSLQTVHISRFNQYYKEFNVLLAKLGFLQVFAVPGDLLTNAGAQRWGSHYQRGCSSGSRPELQ